MIRHNALPHAMRGVSLVELMVAMTIGLAILASVSVVFVNSKSNYVSQESASRLQETARFATYFLMKDIRLAGYYGCNKSLPSAYNTANPSSNRLAGKPSRFNPRAPIEGNKAGTATWYPSGDTTDFATAGAAVTALAADCPNTVGGRCTNSDAVTVRFADPDSVTPLFANMVGTGSTITLPSGAAVGNFSNGNIIVVTDCANTELVQITGIASDALSHAGSSGNPGNVDANLVHAFSAPPTSSTEIMRYAVRRYYIGTGSSGHPALFRQNVLGSSSATASTSTVELVEGVESMQLLYGVDMDGDRDPNAFLQPNDANLAATTGWDNVTSVRLVLTVRPVADPNVKQSSTTAVTGVSSKTFTTTVVLRNLK